MTTRFIMAERVVGGVMYAGFREGDLVKTERLVRDGDRWLIEYGVVDDKPSRVSQWTRVGDALAEWEANVS